MALTKTFAVAPLGVGRKDYSLSVEYATESLVRSHQTKQCWSAQYDVGTAPYPPSDFGVLFFDSLPGEKGDGDFVPGYTIYATKRTNYFSEVDFTTDADSLWMVKFGKYATLDDVIADSLLVDIFAAGFAEEILWRGYGYQGIHFNFTAPLPTDLEKVYAFITRTLVEKPTFEWLILVSGVEDSTPLVYLTP
jgi:hypothetical protein